MPDPTPETDLPAKLTAPAQRALANAGIQSLADLSRRTHAEIAFLHGIGPNALKQLQQALDAAGLSFAMPCIEGKGSNLTAEERRTQ